MENLQFKKDFNRIFKELIKLVEFSKISISKEFDKNLLERRFNEFAGTYYSRLLHTFCEEIEILYKFNNQKQGKK